MQGLRNLEHFVDRRIVSPLLGASRLEPCRLHVALTFYRVGAQEVSAATQDTPTTVRPFPPALYAKQFSGVVCRVVWWSGSESRIMLAGASA